MEPASPDVAQPELTEALGGGCACQEAIAELGKKALSHPDLFTLLQEAAALVTHVLGVEYGTVLELLPDNSGLLLRAGVGWNDGYVGRATVAAGRESDAGYTLLWLQPVIVNDLRTETRFRVPPLLVEHGVVSGVSVAIHGDSQPFGVLGAHTTERRAFTADEVSFLQAIANVLALAVERIRAEEVLRESEERFRKVFEDGPLGMCIVTPQFVFTKVNSRLCDILGYTEDELIGRGFSEFTLPDDMPDNLMLAQAAFEAVVPVYHVEKRYIRKDGQVIQSKVTGVVIRDQAGNPLYGVGIIEDITALKEAEEALRDSERRLRSTQDGMLEGCQVIGFDWRYLYANDAVARHGRRTKEELLGHTMMEVYPGIDETEMFGYLRRCMEQRIPHRMQTEFTYPGGARGRFELSIQPVPEGIFILSLDITERMRAEAALQEAREQLEAKAEQHVRPANPYELTFREVTVLHLIATGKADKEIAATLGISALTASKHVANILAKMQASSRTEAGVRAVREELIT